MSTYFLAVDIGASSGRHILGSLSEGKLLLEEVHRFSNGMERKNGILCWNTEKLFDEILTGMKKCRTLGKVPVSMGIDTWGVDFVLLDETDRLLGEAVGYRDGRTRGMDEKVERVISPERLYRRTGIQKQMFNTIYQLMAIKEKKPELLKEARSLLMIPDYFHFLLTGKKAAEYTEASTSQLLSPKSRDWDRDLLEELGYPTEIFQAVRKPGSFLGRLLPDVAAKVGFDCRVLLPPSHDTASAVAAVPTTKDPVLYISSGTWSLLGTELSEADCREESRLANYSNEGGYYGRFRYLKNIMGLWMIQSVQKEWEAEGHSYSFARICREAEACDVREAIDCNDPVFLAPESMQEAILTYCREKGVPQPKNHWEMAALIYYSLAVCYRDAIGQLEKLRGRTYDAVHIVGGGANAAYLNRLTARLTGKTVYAGPTEATATGNLLTQMIHGGALDDLRTARQTVYDSFAVETFHP